jgi:hypothetical protein
MRTNKEDFSYVGWVAKYSQPHSAYIYPAEDDWRVKSKSRYPTMQQYKEITIKSFEFREALLSYFDAEKLDNLVTAQAENLSVQWHQHPCEMVSTSSNSDSFMMTHISASNQSFPEEGCRLQGQLSIANGYICVDLEARVLWKYWSDQQNAYGEEIKKSFCGTRSKPEYVLHFQLSASAEIIESVSVQISKQVGLKMKKRLQEDPYIRKLLSCSSSNTTNLARMPVCEAIIEQKWPSENNNLNISDSSPSIEERVDVSEEAVEGIRRAILSQSDCNLTIMEVLLTMPWLATSSTSVGFRSRHKSILNGWDTYLSSTSLDVFRSACDRAALRLLEDALLDACEREGEEDILEDLNLNDAETELRKDSCQMTSNEYVVKNREGGKMEQRRTRTDSIQCKRSKRK